MQQKKIGIVGFGTIAKHIGRELRLATGGLATVAAVLEPNDEKFRQSCEFIGYEPLRCDSIRLMFEHALDGIIVASPNYCHLENLKEWREHMSGRSLWFYYGYNKQHLLLRHGRRKILDRRLCFPYSLATLKGRFPQGDVK